ncbi:AGCS family alanine or glycine:cation symporter [Endozoicomonas sp. NE40]|uniref:AGCS family alanine or glycine:cation symporter n=2 Tax=Endozoicomonas lisbonensis TaxID=3120522 RepID=A0ABV2SC41_9GAMM
MFLRSVTQLNNKLTADKNMEQITNIVNAINGVVWGPLMLVLILGVGLFLMLGLRLMPLLKLGTGFKLLWSGRTPAEGDDKAGEISPFQALMTALSATVGTGNIAGVATAVFLGGPGALFWMWCTALVGMATKFAEAVLAVKFREADDKGNHYGGPMYYIKNGLGSRWAWLGTLFALFGAIAGFGIGNTVQSNSVAAVLEANFSLPTWITGVALMVLVGLVLIGGIRRIGQVAGALVPFMAITYLLAGLGVLAINAAAIPEALSLVFTYAFSPVAATGGFAGAAVWAAIRFGVARGVFSNEAGLGSAPIAHAAAKTKDPVRQGMIAMLGTFIDTIIICTITGLVIITSGLWTSGESGAALTSMAFAKAMPGVGNYIVTFSLAIFAFTTTLGWSFYGERCLVYLFGPRSVKPYRILWIIALPIGATLNLNFIWLVADTLNAMMAIPNLIALVLLSPVVFRLVRDYMAKEVAEKEGKTIAE